MENTDELLNEVIAEKDIFRRAKLIQALKDIKKVPAVKISQALGMKPSYLSHVLRLNKLPILIVDGYYSNSISISHLFIISRLEKEEDMIQIYERVLAENLTAIQTEELVRQKLYNIKNSGNYLSEEEVSDFVKSLEEAGVQSKVIQSRIKGKLELEVKGNLAQNSQKLREMMGLLKSQASLKTTDS